MMDDGAWRRPPWPVSVVAGGVVVLAAFAALYRFDPPLYAAILRGWGVEPYRFPFLDTHAVLSALQCARQGLDTYIYNPCDVLTRAFVYSPLILDAAVFPVTTAWTNWAGVVLAAAFFLCVASLPVPRGWREWVITAFATLSTMSAFALERGNIDVAIFVLVTLAVHFLRGRPTARAMGYLLILFAALLKYYPIIALAAALRERPRRLLLIAALTGAALVLFAVHYWRGLQEAMTRVPAGSHFTDFFGAVNLPFGLATLLSPVTEQVPASAPFLAIFPWLILTLLLISCARRAIAGFDRGERIAQLPKGEALFLAVGAVVMVGCFFVGQSIGYRGIFFLLLLPGLLALSRAPEDRRFGRTACLIVFLMWGEMFRQALQHTVFHDPGVAAAWQVVKVAFWMFREIVWWRVIGTLTGLILCFVATSEIGEAAIERLMPARKAVR